VVDSSVDGGAGTASCEAGTAPGATATSVSNPAATQTTTSNGLVLHKELNGFANYGSQDGAADVLYDGQVGAWTFAIPSVTIKSAALVVSVVADDHAGVPTSEYSFRMWVGSCSYEGPSLPHGSPADTRFTNWVPVTEVATPTPGTSFTLTIANSSTTGSTGINWIGIDWVELRLVTQ
jgi:hypothetical protein